MVGCWSGAVQGVCVSVCVWFCSTVLRLLSQPEAPSAACVFGPQAPPPPVSSRCGGLRPSAQRVRTSGLADWTSQTSQQPVSNQQQPEHAGTT